LRQFRPEPGLNCKFRLDRNPGTPLKNINALGAVIIHVNFSKGRELCVAIEERMASLCVNRTVNTQWSKLKDAIKESAVRFVGQERRKKQRSHGLTEETIKKIEERRK